MASESGACSGTAVTRMPVVIGAPSSIGIRPYDDSGRPRSLDRAPDALRNAGVVERLGAADRGDVLPPAYVDFERPPGGIRNAEQVERYCRRLAGAVADAIGRREFPIVLGGDCSILLGALAGAKARRGRVGLAYIDAHADFAAPEESRTGSAAGMCLALAVGRGGGRLTRLMGDEPLLQEEDAVLIGRRDGGQVGYGHSALYASEVLDITEADRLRDGSSGAAARALNSLECPGLAGFWVHVDADVLDPAVMPAVDSPEPGGPGSEELVHLLRPLLSHPGALGLQLTIYDPEQDPHGSGAELLVRILERACPRDERSAA